MNFQYSAEVTSWTSGVYMNKYDQTCSNLSTTSNANNKVFHYLIEPYRTFNGVRGAIQTQEPGSCIWRQGPWKPISMPDRFELNDKKKTSILVIQGENTL